MDADDWAATALVDPAIGRVVWSGGVLGPRRGAYGIYRSQPVNGGYAAPEPLGSTINTKHNDWCPYVDPDERFIVFSSNRPGGLGGLDLYISHTQPDGA